MNRLFILLFSVIAFASCSPLYVHYVAEGPKDMTGDTIYLNGRAQAMTVSLRQAHYPTNSIATHLVLTLANRSGDTLRALQEPIVSLSSSTNLLDKTQVNEAGEKRILAPGESYSIRRQFDSENFKGSFPEFIERLRGEKVQVILSYSDRQGKVTETVTLVPDLSKYDKK